jgi:hypothetical protein
MAEPVHSTVETRLLVQDSPLLVPPPNRGCISGFSLDFMCEVSRWCLCKYLPRSTHFKGEFTDKRMLWFLRKWPVCCGAGGGS